MRRVHVIVTIVAAFSQLLAYGQGAGQHPFTFEDMMSLKRISGPQISPDGKWVLFSAVDVNLEENKNTPHLWVIALAGGETRQLTTWAEGEDRGRWSPDVALYHSAATENSFQDALLPRRRSLGPEAAEQPALVPDCKRMGGPISKEVKTLSTETNV